MRMEIDNLRKLYQSYVISKTPTDRKDCPSPNSILKTIRTPGSLTRKKKLIDHLSSCSSCLEEFGLIIKVEYYDRYYLVDPYLNSQRLSIINPFRLYNLSRHFVKYAIIMVGFILIVFSFITIKDKDIISNSLRNNSQAIQLIQPDHIHDLLLPLIFQWGEYPDAEYYIIELFNDKLFPLWTSPRIVGLTFRLPNDILTKLERHKTCFWMISAYSSTEKIAESDLASFIAR